ncbi:TAXI family TRAP transporter solute-binding subunit [Streptomyces sporangiiformans]|uniref:TAXI family TRAP transporter solute-binding subunit n=1 Tax=Streptomyces sporangiiformans TaxID=2315329 RepID=A0A505CV30_9ACTN|nr:TAXI family TRAP transporter solute-binding subunit [Streptomyces sporangiiformans]TPQ15923.1 TAXI family TRAP transporter solute-binding subunit [Streptomyces sporangiiformans]
MFQVLGRIGRRRVLQGSTAAFVAFGLLLWWLLPLGESSPGGTVTFSTGTRTGVYQLYGELLQKALAKDMPRLDVKLLNSEGSQENVARVATGEADFTIAAADAVEKYKLAGGPGADQLRGCARLYDDYMHVVVPRASSVDSIRDLRGKKVAVGQPGSGVRLIAGHVLEAAGLDLGKDITPVSEGIGTMPKLLEEGKIDAFFWSGGLPTSAVTDLSTSVDIRLVPIDEDLIAKLHKQGRESRYYRAAVMPADAYPKAQAGTAVPTLAVANLLVTRADTDAELTEGLTRTVIDSRDRIGGEVHAAQLVDLRTAIYTDPLDLHEGARRYYRSVKP